MTTPDAPIVQAAEQVAAQIEQTEIAARDRVDDVLEASQDRIAEAEAAAQRIGDAAMATALGQRIDGVASEIGACRTQLTQVEGRLTGLQTQITEALARPVVSLTPAPSAPATPQAAEIDPADVVAPAAAKQAPGSHPANKRRRVL